MEQISKKQAVRILFSNNFCFTELEQHEEIVDEIDKAIDVIFLSKIDLNDADVKDSLGTLLILRDCLKCR